MNASYTREEKQHARKVLGFRTDDGTIPLEERTVESLIDLIAMQRVRHQDRITEMQGTIDALHARLKFHRKAKSLANKRADTAVAAMRDMLSRFQETNERSYSQEANDG
jgi:hypothetical protein